MTIYLPEHMVEMLDEPGDGLRGAVVLEAIDLLSHDIDQAIDKIEASGFTLQQALAFVEHPRSRYDEAIAVDVLLAIATIQGSELGRARLRRKAQRVAS